MKIIPARVAWMNIMNKYSILAPEDIMILIVDFIPFGMFGVQTSAIDQISSNVCVRKQTLARSETTINWKQPCKSYCGNVISTTNIKGKFIWTFIIYTPDFRNYTAERKSKITITAIVQKITKIFVELLHVRQNRFVNDIYILSLTQLVDDV